MEFMVIIRFKPLEPAEIAPLIPREQARFQELTEQGIVKKAWFSHDRKIVFVEMKANLLEDAEAALRSLPLYPYMNLEIVQLEPSS